MIKRGIKPGYHDRLMAGKSYKDWLDLTKYVHDVLAEQNYPVTGDCCIAEPADGDIGKALVIGSNKKISLVTIPGVGGSVSAVSLGTTTSTTQQIVVTGGTNFLLPQATNSLAGLLSAADKTKLSFITVAANVDLANVGNLVTLSGVAANGTNLGTFTGNTIADNLTIKAALQSLETAVEASKLPYVGTFTTGTFTSGSFTIPASTHLKGVYPMVQIMETVSGFEEVVNVNRLAISSIGDITVEVTVGSEFNGKIYIR